MHRLAFSYIPWQIMADSNVGVVRGQTLGHWTVREHRHGTAPEAWCAQRRAWRHTDATLYMICLWTENRARKTHVFWKTQFQRLGWGGVGWGGMSTFLVYTSYIIVCFAAEISGIVATLLVTTLQRSLVLLLRAWFDAADGVGWGACKRCMRCSDDGEKAKTRLRFCKVSNIRNQRGTVVKSPFLDKICTPMSTVSSPAGWFCMPYLTNLIHICIWWTVAIAAWHGRLSKEPQHAARRLTASSRSETCMSPMPKLFANHEFQNLELDSILNKLLFFTCLMRSASRNRKFTHSKVITVTLLDAADTVYQETEQRRSSSCLAERCGMLLYTVQTFALHDTAWRCMMLHDTLEQSRIA